MIEYAFENGVARTRLNRPEARNAIPMDEWSAIAGAVARALDEGARLLVVAGIEAGPFSAGADITDFARFETDPASRTAFRLAIRKALDPLKAAPIPTVAVVEGACYGAGVALAMACDMRFVSPAAEFAITPAKLGISYPQEDVHRLVELVGPGHAARLLFSGATIDAAEAARIGLADLVAHDIDQAFRSFADALLANDGASIGTLKRGIALALAGYQTDSDQDRAFEDLLGAPELHRRLAAYRDRRR